MWARVIAEFAHQQMAVGGVGFHGGWPGGGAAAGEAGPVVAEQPVVAGQSWLVQERLGPYGADAPVDEHDRFPGSAQLIVQLDPVDSGSVQHVSHTLLAVDADGRLSVSSARNRPKASWIGRSVTRNRMRSSSAAII